MEDPVPYNNQPIESFTVYKFEVNQTNPETSIIHSWYSLTKQEAYKMIPANYFLCHEVTINSKDYYLIVHLKSWEENTCYFYINPEVLIDLNNQ